VNIVDALSTHVEVWIFETIQSHLKNREEEEGE
jgi:hypothetical protein